jgi:hypothetical protein
MAAITGTHSWTGQAKIILWRASCQSYSARIHATTHWSMEYRLKRASYAFSQMWITRTDSGTPTPNFAEIVGAGAAAGIANLYHPEAART